MSKFLYWVGCIVIVVGVVVGIYLSIYEEVYYVDRVLKDAGFSDRVETKFNPIVFFTYLIGSGLSGLIFISLGYITEKAEENQAYLQRALSILPKPAVERKVKIGTSKATD